jgi:hypothetical protein
VLSYFGPSTMKWSVKMPFRDQRARAPRRSHPAHVVALWLETVLDDGRWIEGILGCIVAVGVDGQKHSERPNRVVVPRDLRAVIDSESGRRELALHRVLLTVGVRWLGEADLLEHSLLVEELRRVDRERQSDLRVADLEEVDLLAFPLARVVVRAVDQRLQIQPLIGERIGAAIAHRTDDVRRIAARHFRSERVVRLGVEHELAGDLDVVVSRVPLLDHGLLNSDVLR